MRLPLLSPWLVLSLCLLGACASSPNEGTHAPGRPDAGDPPDPDDEPEDEPEDDHCEEGSTDACVCSGGGVGTRTCSGGEYGACENCNLDEGSKCQAGRYVGVFKMRYVPGPAGLCGLFTWFDGEGEATLAFSLAAPEPGAEFYDLVGGESCLVTTLGGGGDAGAPPPVSAEDGGVVTPQDVNTRMALTGSVDCATGEFEGEIRGTYNSVSFCDLGMVKMDYFFKGPVTATFDPATKSFVDGVVTLREPPVLFPLAGEAGGDGTWSATLDPDAPIDQAEEQDCLGIPFQDDLFPPSSP